MNRSIYQDPPTKSDFNWWIEQINYPEKDSPQKQILILIDSNLGRMSLTNDMEAAIAYVISKNGGPVPKHIVYRDSEMIWDGVSIENGVVSFIPIQSHDMKSAMKTILEKVP